jgi:hypothetical protein
MEAAPSRPGEWFRRRTRTAWLIVRVPWAGARQRRIVVRWDLPRIARHQTLALCETRIGLSPGALARGHGAALAGLVPFHGGTVSSNPLCSSGESGANSISRIMVGADGRWRHNRKRSHSRLLHRLGAAARKEISLNRHKQSAPFEIETLDLRAALEDLDPLRPARPTTVRWLARMANQSPTGGAGDPAPGVTRGSPARYRVPDRRCRR